MEENKNNIVKEDEDTRGMTLRAEHFRLQLTNLINYSKIDISTMKYILKDILNEVDILYEKMVSEQYQEFCEAAKLEESRKEKETENLDSDEK